MPMDAQLFQHPSNVSSANLIYPRSTVNIVIAVYLANIGLQLLGVHRDMQLIADLFST